VIRAAPGRRACAAVGLRTLVTMERAGRADRMSDMDAIIWGIERDPRLRSTIVAVLFLDHLPERAALLERLERATVRAPRLRRRVVEDPIAAPRWEPDREFTLAYHVRFTNLGGTGTRRDVLDLAAPIAMQAFDPARPLWELTVVDGLAGGHAAAVAKLHHSLTDGVGGVELMLELFDLEPHPPTGDPALPPPPGHVPSAAARVRDALLDELEHRRSLALTAGAQLFGLALDPAAGYRRTLDTVQSVVRVARPTVRPMSPLLEATSLSCAFDEIERPLAAFTAAARACDARVNDVFVTGLCRGLARWHARHELPLARLRMGMAISVRGANGTNASAPPLPGTAPGANQFLPTRFDVPIDLDDPRSHVAAVRDLVRSQRDEPALGLVEPLSSVLRRLPRPLVTRLFATVLGGQDFVASNVPGAPVPLWFAGARVEGIIAFGPRSGAALNITLLSHDGTAHVGVNHDPVAIPDGAALVAALTEGLDEVLALGTPAPAPRRGRSGTAGRTRGGAGGGAGGRAAGGTPRRATASAEKRPPRR
jgi:diacylglycerol O-acyltransferase